MKQNRLGSTWFILVLSETRSDSSTQTDDVSSAWFACLPALPTERPSIRTPGHSAHHWPGVRQMVQCLLSSGERPILYSGWVSEAGSLGPTHCVCSVDDNDTMRQRVHWAPKKGMKGKHRDSRSPGPHWPFAGEAFCKDLRSFLSCSILDVFGGKFLPEWPRLSSQSPGIWFVVVACAVNVAICWVSNPSFDLGGLGSPFVCHRYSVFGVLTRRGVSDLRWISRLRGAGV